MAPFDQWVVDPLSRECRKVLESAVKLLQYKYIVLINTKTQKELYLTSHSHICAKTQGYPAYLVTLLTF